MTIKATYRTINGTTGVAYFGCDSLDSLTRNQVSFELAAQFLPPVVRVKLEIDGFDISNFITD